MRRRLMAVSLAALFVVLLSLCAQAQSSVRPSQESSFSVVQEPDRITVVHHGSTSWRMVFDRKRGGTVSDFNLPANGPNVVADNSTGLLDGFFSVFYMTTVDGKVAAKGTIWDATREATLRVRSQNDQEVVIEATGTSYGSHMLTPKLEPVVTYRQTYTLQADRVICSGAVQWVYGHGTTMEVLEPSVYFAPGIMVDPLLARGGRMTTDAELPIVGSSGNGLPAPCHYPVTITANLSNGYQLRFRTLHFPSVFARSRWYEHEKPWQTEWATGIGIWGDTRRAGEDFPDGKPVSYQYDMQILHLSQDQVPPRLVIDSPVRESIDPPPSPEKLRKLGDTVRFRVTAIDASGQPVPNDKIEWYVHCGGSGMAVYHVGPTFDFTLPSREEHLTGGWQGENLVWAEVTATNAAGVKAKAYTVFSVDLGPSPKPTGQ